MNASPTTSVMAHPPTWNTIPAPRRAMSLPRTDFIRHLYLGHVTRSSRKTGRTLGHMPSWNEIYPAGLRCRPGGKRDKLHREPHEKTGAIFRARMGYTRRLVSYLALADTIFAGEKMDPLCAARRTRRECLRVHRQSLSRKKTALQNRCLSLGLDPQSCQVVIVIEKLYVTDRLAL